MKITQIRNATLRLEFGEQESSQIIMLLVKRRIAAYP